MIDKIRITEIGYVIRKEVACVVLDVGLYDNRIEIRHDTWLAPCSQEQDATAQQIADSYGAESWMYQGAWTLVFVERLKQPIRYTPSMLDI